MGVRVREREGERRRGGGERERRWRCGGGEREREGEREDDGERMAVVAGALAIGFRRGQATQLPPTAAAGSGTQRPTEAAERGGTEYWGLDVTSSWCLWRRELWRQHLL